MMAVLSVLAGTSVFAATDKPNILVIWGDDVGIQKSDPTIVELLKPMGYVTGQFGKNHFGDAR